jgi:hypothetical protein
MSFNLNKYETKITPTNLKKKKVKEQKIENIEYYEIIKTYYLPLTRLSIFSLQTLSLSISS